MYSPQCYWHGDLAFWFLPAVFASGCQGFKPASPPPPPPHLRSLLGGFCFPSHLFTAAQGCVHLAVAVSQTENTGSWFSDRWREAGLCGRIYMCSGVVEVFMARIFWGGGGGGCSVYVRQHGRKLSGVCVCAHAPGVWKSNNNQWLCTWEFYVEVVLCHFPAWVKDCGCV